MPIAALNGVRSGVLTGYKGIRTKKIGQGSTQRYTYSFVFTSLLTDLPATLTDVSATYTRSGTKRNLQGGLFVDYAADEFGTSYDPAILGYGYLSEPAATNIWIRSSEPANAAWTKANLTISADADSPLSGGGSSSLVPTTGNVRHSITHTTLIASGTLSTFYFVVKQDGYKYVSISRFTDSAATNSWVFDLNTFTIYQNGTADYSNVAITEIPDGDGWCIIQASVNSSTAAVRQPKLFIISNTPPSPVTNNTAAFAGDGTSGILFWNGQAETGGIATSPIVTDGSTATRGADVLSIPRANLTRLLDSAYSIVGDYRLSALPATSVTIASLDDGTAANRCLLGRNSSDAFVNVDGNSGFPGNVSIATTSIARVKQGTSAMEDNLLLSFEGAAGTPDTSVTMPLLPTLFKIGYYSGDQLNGHIFSLSLITEALSQTALDNLTA